MKSHTLETLTLPKAILDKMAEEIRSYAHEDLEAQDRETGLNELVAENWLSVEENGWEISYSFVARQYVTKKHGIDFDHRGMSYSVFDEICEEIRYDVDISEMVYENASGEWFAATEAQLAKAEAQLSAALKNVA